MEQSETHKPTVHGLRACPADNLVLEITESIECNILDKRPGPGQGRVIPSHRHEFFLQIYAGTGRSQGLTACSSASWICECDPGKGVGA